MLTQSCSLPGLDTDEHVVGWAVAGGVIGGLLILWIVVALFIAIGDYVKYQARKADKLTKREAMVYSLSLSLSRIFLTSLAAYHYRARALKTRSKWQ